MQLKGSQASATRGGSLEISTYKRLVEEMTHFPLARNSTSYFLVWPTSHILLTKVSFYWFSSETCPRQKGCVPGLSALAPCRMQFGEQKQCQLSPPNSRRPISRAMPHILQGDQLKRNPAKLWSDSAARAWFSVSGSTLPW